LSQVQASSANVACIGHLRVLRVNDHDYVGHECEPGHLTWSCEDGIEEDKVEDRHDVKEVEVQSSRELDHQWEVHGVEEEPEVLEQDWSWEVHGVEEEPEVWEQDWSWEVDKDGRDEPQPDDDLDLDPE